MIYRSTERVDVELSAIGLGGHEYLPDGRSRGFNEDASLAITPGHLFPGFGAGKRKRVLAAAYEHGINFYDATIDSEKEALGRNLHEMPPPYQAYVQTRPEGMVYTYDEYNRRMADYALLKAEVQRGLELLRREQLDVLNVAFMGAALEHDPRYLEKIAENVGRLKQEGLIRWANADTFSGEETYLRQIAQDCFDGIYINLNFADHYGQRQVLPAAHERGMAVFAREAFMKGALFRMGAEASVTDRDRLARVALKWLLAHEEITVVVVGADVPAQLANSASVLDELAVDEVDEELLRKVRGTAAYQDYEQRKRVQFGYGQGGGVAAATGRGRG
jgi:aryl-alcohol dehydrogenase-like predicted oxidoreductase